jgi:hypothetical protein
MEGEMKSEKEINKRLEEIEKVIEDDDQDFRALETERDTLEWVLEEEEK